MEFNFKWFYGRESCLLFGCYIKPRPFENHVIQMEYLSETEKKIGIVEQKQYEKKISLYSYPPKKNEVFAYQMSHVLWHSSTLYV